MLPPPTYCNLQRVSRWLLWWTRGSWSRRSLSFSRSWAIFSLSISASALNPFWERCDKPYQFRHRHWTLSCLFFRSASVVPHTLANSEQTTCYRRHSDSFSWVFGIVAVIWRISWSSSAGGASHMCIMWCSPSGTNEEHYSQLPLYPKWPPPSVL